MEFLPALVSAAGAIGGGYLSGQGQKNKETKLQKTQRHLIDQILGSLSGGGTYSDLFNTDQAAFEKSFINPAKSIFENQIAPQIQQSYIASGQQRGTGLEDQLLRAGVDLDQMLNQNYLQFQNLGKDRMSQMLMGILGAGAGAPTNPSGSQNLMSAAGGFLSSKGFANQAPEISKGIMDYFTSDEKQAGNNEAMSNRKGYLPETYNYNG